MLKIILLLLICVVAFTLELQALGNQPVPKCQTGFFYRTLPLIADQAYITNLDHLFDGYNLQFKLEDHEDFKQFIQLGEKIKLQDHEQVPDVPLIGIKNYHIQKKGNTWGSTFIVLTERSEKTFVHYGVINSNTSTPVVNNYIVVENSTNTTCFDAVLFKNQDLILIDCVVKLPKPNSKGQVLQNIFYYHKISDGSFIRNLKTQMYINFRSITRRSLTLYSDLFNQHTFLLRTYFHNQIQKPMNQNTFIQVFMITDPEDPWIVQIIDRSFLNSKTLSITDVKIYLGEIFILDIKMGVYRVYINDQQDLKYNGYFQMKGFEKMNVYSNNLDDHFQLALVNSHSVLQIDWTNKQQPRLINKYSLMPQSKVSQIFINQRFVFIQSESKAENTTYNYTWIMNRGDRTYTKAFKVIKHNSSRTIIDVNEDMSYLIIIDEQKIGNYRVDDSNMVIRLKRNQELLDKINTFKITAISKDEMDSEVVKKCQILVNFTLLQDNNKAMWPIGDMPPSKFTANFPGKVQIKLHEYVLGPNITYKLRQSDYDVIKKMKVYQQQQLSLSWQVQPPFISSNQSKIQFLLTQTINYQDISHDIMHLYMQDDQNITYFITCVPEHFKESVQCNFTHQQQFEGEINNWASGFFVNRYSLEQNHVIGYTTKKYYNKVSLIDFTKNQRLSDVNLENGFAGNATSVGITDRQLYVVLKYVKNVQIYDLQLCLQGLCQPKCQLNHLLMYKLGVKYFSPTQVHTSVYHPNIIFIKTSDQIIVVDYNAQCRPKLLSTILPVQSAEIQFSFKVNQKFLIITIGQLNTIKQYNIERIQLGDVRFTKQYPRYGFSLPTKYDIDISDKGNCIYVTMVSQDGDYQIFVYRSGFPAVGTLYDVIDLFDHQQVLVDTTGYQIDYVSVFSNNQLRIFRQYQQPLAQVFNPNISYSFYLDYSNPASRSNLQLIDVKIINLPTYIKINPQLHDIMFTKDLLYSGTNKVNQINDTQWWEGNVLVVYADCQDCRGQDPNIRVLNHIQHQQQIRLVPAMSQYQWGKKGGSIQTMNSILNMRHNGTVRQIVKLPFKDNQLCITLAIGYQSEYQVSGCLAQKAINLYLTSFISEKGFAFEAFQTTATNLFKLEAVNDLIILVDIQSNPYRKTRPGGIYLYGLNLDDQIPSPFVQVQYIDGDDIGMQQLGQLYFNNAELTFNPSSDSYRLYITQLSRGVFVVDFKYYASSNTISIRAINHLKIQPLLTKLGYQMPYDASYQAIAKIQSHYDQTLKKVTDKMLLTTGKFHTIQLIVQYGIEGNLQNMKMSRLYLRYAFYDIQNYIKYHNGLFVISQILPEEFDIQDRSKQILTTYSTTQNRTFGGDVEEDEKIEIQVQDKVQERGFLGGFKINDTVLHNYDFNLTYTDDGHTEPRVGMVLIEYLSNKIQKFTLHQNLSVVTKQMIDTQVIFIQLKNDFSVQKFRILINGYSPYSEWKFIMIILFSIIGGVLLIVGILIGVRKIRQKYGGIPDEDQNKQSMITASDRRSFEPLTLRDTTEDRNSSRESKKQQKKRQKQFEKQQKRRQKEEKQKEKQRLRQERDKEKYQAQSQKEADKQRNKQRARERQSDKERQRQMEKQRQRESQKERQTQKSRQKQRQSPFSSYQRNQTRNTQSNYNNYTQNRLQQNQEALSGNASRFGQRRAFRQRPQRNTQFTGNRQPPPPPSRARRNIAIIEE